MMKNDLIAASGSGTGADGLANWGEDRLILSAPYSHNCDDRPPKALRELFQGRSGQSGANRSKNMQKITIHTLNGHKKFVDCLKCGPTVAI